MRRRSDSCRNDSETGRWPSCSIGNSTGRDRKSTRLNSSHSQISYAVFCLKKKRVLRHVVRLLLIFLCLIQFGFRRLDTENDKAAVSRKSGTRQTSLVRNQFTVLWDRIVR